MPDLGQVDIFDPDLPGALNRWYYDEESGYGSEQGSEFEYWSESESEAIVSGK